MLLVICLPDFGRPFGQFLDLGDGCRDGFMLRDEFIQSLAEDNHFVDDFLTVSIPVGQRLGIQALADFAFFRSHRCLPGGQAVLEDVTGDGSHLPVVDVVAGVACLGFVGVAIGARPAVRVTAFVGECRLNVVGFDTFPGSVLAFAAQDVYF